MTINHESNTAVRVVGRGRSWYVQEHSNRTSSREYDPWTDIAPACETQDEAVALMKSRYPVSKDLARSSSLRAK